MTSPETRPLADLLGLHPLVEPALSAALRAGAFLRDAVQCLEGIPPVRMYGCAEEELVVFPRKAHDVIVRRVERRARLVAFGCIRVRPVLREQNDLFQESGAANPAQQIRHVSLIEIGLAQAESKVP